MRQRAGLAGRNVPKQVGNDPLRQVVGFNRIGHSQLLQLRYQAPMSTHDPFHHARMPQVIKPPAGAVALARGVHQGQVAGRAGSCFGLRVQKPLFQCHCHRLRKANANKATGGHCVAVVDQSHSLGGADDFVALRALRGGVFEKGVHRCFRSRR